MDFPDNDLIAILVRSATIRETETSGLVSWWNTERRIDESLATFLLREGVLNDGASRMLGLCRKGYLQIDGATTLLQERGQDRLRQAISSSDRELSGRSVAVAVAVAVAEATSTSQELIPRPAPIEASSRGTSRSMPRVGEHLGKCLLTDEIGRGGYGVVYRALHTSLKIPVAVKLLLIDADPEIIEAFRAEALTMARLIHPNVVRVLDFDDQDIPYLVLEYIEGPSLRDLIQQSGRIRVDRAVAIMLQVARGLEASSAQEIVHRDVTPANILMTRDGTAKLTDYGLAAFVADLETSPDLENRGTAAYMSPEQARGDTVDARSDLYSLGATFYHAVTGSPPFPGGTRMEILLRHAMEVPAPPASIVPEIEPVVSDLILRMIAKLPEHRFDDFGELIAELEAITPAAMPVAERHSRSGASSSSGRKKAWLERIVGFGRD